MCGIEGREGWRGGACAVMVWVCLALIHDIFVVFVFVCFGVYFRVAKEGEGDKRKTTHNYNKRAANGAFSMERESVRREGREGGREGGRAMRVGGREGDQRLMKQHNWNLDDV